MREICFHVHHDGRFIFEPPWRAAAQFLGAWRWALPLRTNVQVTCLAEAECLLCKAPAGRNSNPLLCNPGKAIILIRCCRTNGLLVCCSEALTPTAVLPGIHPCELNQPLRRSAPEGRQDTHEQSITHYLSAPGFQKVLPQIQSPAADLVTLQQQGGCYAYGSVSLSELIVEKHDCLSTLVRSPQHAEARRDSERAC